MEYSREESALHLAKVLKHFLKRNSERQRSDSGTILF